MGLVNDVTNKVRDYLDGDYEVEEVRSIPSVENVPFGKKAKKINLCSFAIDLRKSSELLKVHQKQTSGKIHKAFLTATAIVVNDLGGEIRSFNGDGLLAFWPANEKEELDTAVKTGMRLKWFLDIELSPLFKKYTKLDFGIGIDWGEVYILRAGISREANNNDLIFIGKCVNLAVAISKKAQSPYHVEISESTYSNLTEKWIYGTSQGVRKNMWTNSSIRWNDKTYSTKKTNWHSSMSD